MAKKKKGKTANEVKKETVVSENTSYLGDDLKEEAKIAEALLKGESVDTEKVKAEESKAETEKTKTDEVRTEEVKTAESEVEESKTEKVKAEKTKTEEVKTGDAKTEKTKTEEVKTEESKVENPQTDGSEKTEEPKAEKTKTEKSLVKNSPKALAKKVDQKVEQKAHELEKTKDAKEAEKALKKLADEADSGSKVSAKKDSKDETVPDKKKYAEIMKTDSFVKAFVLMLIPGINIICVLFWAIGAAKNKNKVHFTRACIILFIIEIFLTAILLGAGYIAASVKETEVLDWMDNKTNGLISYFEIDSYKELPKLLDTSKHLKTPEEENPTEPEVPKTCYVYNPDGIDSYDTFMELWNAKFHKETVTEPTTTEPSTTEPATTKPSTAESAAQTKDLFTILEENNVDTKESKMIYIIIDNDKESCVIAFDPTGKLQSFPEVKINNENVFIGGTK